MARAIAPLGEGRGAGVALTIARPNELDGLVRSWIEDRGGDGVLDVESPRPVAIMLEVEAGIQASGAAVSRLLSSGGGLWWIADSAASVAALSGLSSSAGEPVAPIVPADTGAWRRSEAERWAVGRFDHPVLSVFEGPSRSELLGRRVEGVMRGRLTPDAEPLLFFETGEPALAMRWSGAGRVAVLGGSLSPGRSGLARSAMLVPLVHQMIRHLAPGPTRREALHPGAALASPPDQSWQWFYQQTAVGAGRPVRYEGSTVAAPGWYTLRRSAGDEIAGGVWAVLDPKESDLRVAPERAAAAGAEQVDDADGQTGAVSAMADPDGPGVEEAVELWPYAALAALLLAGLETLLLWRFARPRKGGV